MPKNDARTTPGTVAAPAASAPTRPAGRHTSAAAPGSDPDGAATTPACPVDLSIQCPQCAQKMQPEHAHYRCLRLWLPRQLLHVSHGRLRPIPEAGVTGGSVFFISTDNAQIPLT